MAEVIKLPYKKPKWIYEGTDPDLVEPVAADVTNRAPKQIEKNVEKVKHRLELDIQTVNSITGLENTDWSDSENYPKGIVVLKDDKKWLSIKLDSDGNNKDNEPSSDSDYWKEWLGVDPAPAVFDRAPTNDDKGYHIGQIWVDYENNRVYSQTSTDADDPNWIETTNKGDTDLATTVVDSNYTATANTYILTRSSDDTDDYTVKLPSNPADMDLVKIGDYDANASNNPVHINGNGKKIEGHNDINLDADDFLVEFTYNSDKGQWVILNK